MGTMTANSVLANVYHELVEADPKEEVSQENVESNDESVDLCRAALVFLKLRMARFFPEQNSIEFGQDDDDDRDWYSDSHELMSGDCRFQKRVTEGFIVAVKSSLVGLYPFVENEHGNRCKEKDDM